MRSPNGSIHTTQTPPPLSFYNTFKTVIFPYCTVKSSFLYVLFSLLEEGFYIDRLIAAVSEIVKLHKTYSPKRHKCITKYLQSVWTIKKRSAWAQNDRIHLFVFAQILNMI
jgi:hypothetical protein